MLTIFSQSCLISVATIRVCMLTITSHQFQLEIACSQYYFVVLFVTAYDFLVALASNIRNLLLLCSENTPTEHTVLNIFFENLPAQTLLYIIALTENTLQISV